MIADDLGRNTEQRRHGLDHRGPIIGHDAGEDQHVDLDVVVAVAGSVAHPPELLIGHRGRAVLCRGPIGASRADRRVDADDVGSPRRKGEHPSATTADEHRGTLRLLYGLGQTIEPTDPIVLALIAERARSEQAFEHVECLFQPVDPHAGRIHGDARLFVVAAHPAGADAELQPSARQPVDARHLLGQDHRVPVVVVENQGADPQLRRGIGGGHERHRRRELVAEVVRHEQRRVTEAFGLAGQLGPVGAGVGPAELDAEAEGSQVRHDAHPSDGTACPALRRFSTR